MGIWNIRPRANRLLPASPCPGPLAPAPLPLPDFPPHTMTSDATPQTDHTAPPTASPHVASGPLRGLRVVEFAGLGPAPFACMLLSDMGAQVITIDRPGRTPGDPRHIVGRGRQVVLADLKDDAQCTQVQALVAQADVLVEGFRPGVMERLGLGPEPMLARNPRLVYGRMTGWGQQGPLAQSAGHDINYIALSGALHAIGPYGGDPVPPLNLVGDYGGGSLYLVMGLLAALHERQHSGQGQVVDAAITDGALSLMTQFIAGSAKGQYEEVRGSNLLDGGAPFYGVYATADGRHMALGPLEPAFFAELCDTLGLDAAWHQAQYDRKRWPQLRETLQRIFLTRTQQAWCELFEGSDACVSPVLSLSQALAHPQNRQRQAVLEVAGVQQPAPAPRFSRTPSAVQGPNPAQPTSLSALLSQWQARPTP